VLRGTGKEKEDWLQRKKRRHVSVDRSKAAKDFGDPYIYSDYLEADIVEPKQQVHIPPFNDIVGHGYVEDHDGDDNVNNDPAGERRDFDFDDLVPILEDDEDEYDLETDFHRFEADAGYLDEGEIEVSVPAEQQPAPGNFPPFVDEEENTPAPRLRLRIPRGRVRHDILEWVSGSAGEPRGASLKEQTAYLSNLMDEIDRYTSKAEVTQRKVRGRDPEYQRLVQIEIRKGAEELQDQLTRAERILDPIAISNARTQGGRGVTGSAYPGRKDSGPDSYLQCKVGSNTPTAPRRGPCCIVEKASITQAGAATAGKCSTSGRRRQWVGFPNQEQEGGQVATNFADPSSPDS